MWAPYVAAFQHDSKVLKETSPERESKEEGIALSVALVSEVTQFHIYCILLVDTPIEVHPGSREGTETSALNVGGVCGVG